MRRSGFRALLRECRRRLIKAVRSADPFTPLDADLALLCGPWLLTLAQPEDDTRARGAPLMRRGGGTHGINSPSASDGSDVSWGRMMQFLQGDGPAQANPRGRAVDSSATHAGKGKAPVGQSPHVYPHGSDGAVPALSGPEAIPQTDEVLKDKGTHESRVVVGQKRKRGGQPGRTAWNRGKMMPSFVKGSDGELRPRKPPGYKPGHVPWNKGKSSQEQQEYRLQRGKLPNNTGPHVYPHGNDGAVSALTGPEAIPQTDAVLKDKGTHESRVVVGQKRKRGGQPGRTAWNR